MNEWKKGTYSNSNSLFIVSGMIEIENWKEMKNNKIVQNGTLSFSDQFRFSNLNVSGREKKLNPIRSE